MASCTAEFTIEPFTDGAPGPHVDAAIDAVVARGFEPHLDPFSSRITGSRPAVVAAINEAITAAMDAGATRISVTFTQHPEQPDG